MKYDLWCRSALGQRTSLSTLDNARWLVLKTAGLSSLIAPQTAACLSELLQVTSGQYSKVVDGYQVDQEFLENAVSLEIQQCTLGEGAELGLRILAVLEHHYRILRRRPHVEGNKTIARVVTQQQFARLGLRPHLWSLSRGLARKYEEYQHFIGMDDHVMEGALPNDRQITREGTLGFVDFMLGVCHEEVDYIGTAFFRQNLRERVLKMFRTNQQLLGAGVKVKTGPAVLALLTQGWLPEAEFKTFTGLPPQAASDELNRLRYLGVVANSQGLADRVEPRLPRWFAEEILPCL
ncbi:hypothetical protein D3C76_816710 [compost metagenome]